MSGTLASFVPPFCPRITCPFHTSALGWRWILYGHYTRDASPQRIARFRCVHCRRTFSTQTFSTTYYLKRPQLLEPIAHRILACSGYRQIAREARCAHTTVMGQAARLGRHALLFLTRHRPPPTPDEPLVMVRELRL
jgi:transposase-like protein